MAAVTKARRRDYTSIFLGIVLAGLVVIVWGLVMASVYSVSATARGGYLSRVSRQVAPAVLSVPDSVKSAPDAGTN
ncbi:MAG: hypothetical protein K2W78_13270 [Xanthobacteraceae bacterium]|nr:hypothetical protein [Xanthobacteraceae bacterium]